jgi:hypothetical protein
MKFNFKEKLIFAFGICGLLLLLAYQISNWSRTPMPPPSSDKPAIPEAFTAAHPLKLNGMVFSVDRKREIVLAHDVSTGKLIWESEGEDGFIIPGAAFPIALSPDGELWVGNVGLKRLEQLNPATGKFIASWQPKESFAGCCNPVRFSALPNGRFLTMEKGSRKACIYLPSGELDRVVTDKLSGKEDNFYLYQTDHAVHLYDAGTSWEMAVPYD